MVSDSHSSEIAPAKDHIKGDRRIIIIPDTQEGLKEFTRKLTNVSGVRKVSRGAFIIESNNESIRKIVELIPHISFKKVRDIPKMRDKSKDAKLKRTFALVTYHLRDPSPQRKKKIQRLGARSVSIRLRPGILLFPHLRVKDNRKYFETDNGKRLLNSKDFTAELKKLDAEYSRFTHLRIVGPRSLGLVNTTLERMVLRKCETLTEKAGMIREAVKNPEIPTAKLKERYSSLFLYYKDSKASYDVIRQIMSIESPDPFKKIYDRLLRVRKLITERTQP
jgi:hypothetical protein